MSADEEKKGGNAADTGIGSLLSALTGSFKIPDGLFDGLDAETGGGSAAEETQPSGGIGIPPELLLRLPEIMKAARPIADMLGGMPRGGGGLGILATDKETGERRRALLSALRPYMSERRRATVDLMISIGRLSEMLGER